MTLALCQDEAAKKAHELVQIKNDYATREDAATYKVNNALRELEESRLRLQEQAVSNSEEKAVLQTQHSQLTELLNGDDAGVKSGDGFWARFLWVVP